MGKTRIHDLAAEFGIESGQLISLLADMGIHVRSHLSALAADQVALVRARWEREKRKATAPANNGFGNHGDHGFRPFAQNGLLDHRSVVDAAEGRFHMNKTRHQRPKFLLPLHLASGR